MAANTSLNDQLRALATTAENAVTQARVRAGELTHAKRGQIDSALSKAAKAVNDRTGNSYASTIEKVRAGVSKGVDLVESQRTAGAATAPGASSPATTATPATPAPGTPAPATPATPPPPATPAQTTPPEPAPPAAEGWHRDANGNWVRTERP